MSRFACTEHVRSGHSAGQEGLRLPWSTRGDRSDLDGRSVPVVAEHPNDWPVRPFASRPASIRFVAQQVTPRAHLLAARRACVRTHTPFTRCIPAPHAARTGVTSVSGWRMDTGGKACADDAKVRAKATAINLSIVSLPLFSMFRPTRTARSRGHGVEIPHCFECAESNRPAE
jgi:hypothetical protein